MPANARPVAPAVSVLMSVYNGLPHLGAAVESILAQTFTDFEFVIIDDGSKDGSTEQLRRYVDLDPRIVLVSRANRGLIASLNEAAELSRAPLLARMDADDVSHPTRFARQVETFAGRSGLIALGTWVRFIDASGRVTGTGEGSPVGEAAVANAFVEGTGFVAHPTLMMRREAFEAVGGYRAAYLHAEDLDLLYRLSFAGTIDNLPEHLLDYRTHEHNVSVRHALEMQTMGSLLNVLARIRADEGIDLSALAKAPPQLDTMDEVYGRPGLARAVTYRMMHERYVGWPVALKGEALQHMIGALADMRRNGSAADRRRATSLAVRSIKGLVKLGAWRDLATFVSRVFL